MKLSYFDHLTDDQREELAALERGLVVPHTRSAERLAASWAKFVGEVERGYDFTIYDYTNDLDARDLLHRLTVAATPGLSAEIERVLKPFDDRFRAATEPVSKPFRGGGGHRWLSQRMPKLRVGELRDDLVKEGFASNEVDL